MTRNHDEFADIAVQATGLIASIIGVGIMVGKASQTGSWSAVAASLVYGLTLIAMFTFSLLNTVMGDRPHSATIRLLDHAFIYCLIAGTYTPFCLMVIGGDEGRNLLLVMWVAALAGVVMRVLLHRRFQKALITLYVLMGWSGMIHADIIASRLTTASLTLLLAGGALYTLGAPLHRFTKLRYHSALWHGCVLSAAACHYSMVLLILNSPSL
jgi:hemolysin III